MRILEEEKNEALQVPYTTPVHCGGSGPPHHSVVVVFGQGKALSVLPKSPEAPSLQIMQGGASNKDLNGVWSQNEGQGETICILRGAPMFVEENQTCEKILGTPRRTQKGLSVLDGMLEEWKMDWGVGSQKEGMGGRPALAGKGILQCFVAGFTSYKTPLHPDSSPGEMQFTLFPFSQLANQG